eukprot:CAMPEP_0115019050 /NCGR_PEP_ID=MMETSP0216-20121206/29194_1 /TAXON_ID=223996 /ORGANISM="Protocruzia adherens, Strain Boccale" /LENGTH=416 /DNA_ID=CAMNT_0002390409 /DNA_START=15 /DNA_END=1265 /DNA_ORIENTATION=-
MSDLNHPQDSHPWGVDNKVDCAEFRKRGHEMIDFIADMYNNIEDYPISPDVEKGHLYTQMGRQAPENGLSWNSTMRDIKSKIIPGLLHWQHPGFFAYYPGMMGYPALLGSLLGDALNQPGFTWQTCPVASELEVIVLEWLIQAMDLPTKFSRHHGGGSSIQSTASEACLVSMVAARKKKLDQLGDDRDVLKQKLTFYCPDSSHFALQKGASVMGYVIKQVPTVIDSATKNYIMDVNALEDMLNQDKQDGLVPAFVSATLGTTGSGAVDPLEKIGEICKKYDVWYHVDAAYAGSALFCPEYREVAAGIEMAQSYNFNLHKWFPGVFPASILYIEEPKYQVESLNHTAIFLIDDFNQGDSAPDFKDYEVGLGRKFQSLKLWMTLRSYGLEGIRNVIRNHVNLAKKNSSNELLKMIALN